MIIVGIDPAAKNIACTIYFINLKHLIHYIYDFVGPDVNVNKLSARDLWLKVTNSKAWSDFVNLLQTANPDLIIVEDQIREKYRFLQWMLLFTFGDKVIWRKKFTVVNYIIKRCEKDLLAKTGKEWTKNKQNAVKFLEATTVADQRKYASIDHAGTATMQTGQNHNIADSYIYTVYGCMLNGNRDFV